MPLSWLIGNENPEGIKRQLPEFLVGKVNPKQYARWLKHKAAAHVKRDRKRDFNRAVGAAYCDAVHQAVILSADCDACTSKHLHWVEYCNPNMWTPISLGTGSSFDRCAFGTGH